MGQYWPMRIVSLLPSATEIVYALGLAEHLVGVEAMLVSVFRVT
jgi:ABC-type hemin transport system substrate-binding protein